MKSHQELMTGCISNLKNKKDSMEFFEEQKLNYEDVKALLENSGTLFTPPRTICIVHRS